MPKEKFYAPNTVEDNPALTVTWGEHGVRINGAVFDESALMRLIRVLKRATK